jgi:hypothetical protein
MMDEERTRDNGRLALAIGGAAIASAACIATYFTVGGPFGTLNDAGNATTGALSGWLAWRLRGEMTSGVERVATGAALVGAAVTVGGSALVISGTTGWFFAGLVSSVGFAGIGAWLATFNRSAGTATTSRPRLRTLGIAAGALMAVGIAAVPGITLGLDDAATAPAWAWLGSIGWIGTYVAYPAWAVRTGVLGTRRAGGARTAGHGRGDGLMEPLL